MARKRPAAPGPVRVTVAPAGTESGPARVTLAVDGPDGREVRWAFLLRPVSEPRGGDTTPGKTPAAPGPVRVTVAPAGTESGPARVTLAVDGPDGREVRWAFLLRPVAYPPDQARWERGLEALRADLTRWYRAGAPWAQEPTLADYRPRAPAVASPALDALTARLGAGASVASVRLAHLLQLLPAGAAPRAG